jgi:hypothetical protein
MSPERICEAEVWEAPGYWHSHQCSHRAKFSVSDVSGNERFVCGVHNRKRQQLIDNGFVSRDEVAK